MAIRRLCQDDAGNFTVTVKNRHGEKSNHVRLSMKNPNEPDKFPGGIEPAFFRKPTSRQEGSLLHLECEIEALPRPEIAWYLGEQLITESDKYTFYRAIQPSNPNIHYVRLTIKVRSSEIFESISLAWPRALKDASTEDGGNYIVRARNEVGEKDCTLALNFGGPLGDEENVPAKIYEQPELKQPDPSILILEAHVQANPRPKVMIITEYKAAFGNIINLIINCKVSWLCNGDFIKESDRKSSKLEPMPGHKNKWIAAMTILVRTTKLRQKSC